MNITRITRITVTGLAMSAVVLAGAATAVAQPADPSGSVTITLSAEQVAFLCEKRLPKMEARITRLTERITGGPEVRGSTEWLKARAARERDAGRETSAQLLEERAERRAGKIDQLNRITSWVSDFRTKHCGAK